MKSSKKTRWVSRGKSRGAALVEGALLFPVMVMFLPYMAYFHNIHKTEFESMGKSRKEVWAYTSVSCTGTGTTSGTSDTAAGQDSTGQGGKADGAATQARSGLVATGYATASGTADAKPFNVKFTLSKKIKAESWNFCNEITVDPETTNFFAAIAAYL